MSNLVLTVAYSDVPGFVPGTVVGSIAASITDSSGSVTLQNVPEGTAVVTFASVPAGAYTYSVQALDGSGVGLGSAVTGSFTLTAPATITLSLPSSVIASQS